MHPPQPSLSIRSTRRPILSTRRRDFLGLAGLGLAGAAVAQFGPAPTAGAADGEGGQIAFITDVHVDPENQTTMARVRATVDALVELDPVLLLHGGDITEYGSAAEFAAWTALLPERLRSRTHHVPGNHESRWDPSAYEVYDAGVGPRNVSVDAAGLHVVMFDPTWVQQEVAHATDADLAWLAADLERAGDTPTLLVSHYPMGNGYYYVDNAEDVLDVLAAGPVVGHLCGHVHREEVRRLNGFTQISGVSTKNEPGYYLVTRRGDQLDVTFEGVADPTRPDTEPAHREVATIPLRLRGPRDETLEPGEVRVEVTGRSAQVTVRVRPRAQVRSVDAAIYRQDIWAGPGQETWTPLAGDRVRSGVVDLSVLAPGEHRMVVSVTGLDGAVWREVRPFRIAGFAPVWQTRLDGPIQSSPVVVDDDVVVATAGGTVVRLGTGGTEPTQRWSLDHGPVWTNPAVTDDQATIYLGSADHHLSAVSTADGRRRWRVDLGAPVMADPALVDLAGTPAVVVAATDTLWAVRASDGETVWRQDLPTTTCGRPAGNGSQVVVGVGDGFAHAFDAGTGAPLWQTSQTDRSSSYQRMIYGPWDNTVTMLTDDLVLVSTVSQARALDVATGATVWERKGSYIYCPPLLIGDDLVMVNERGAAVRVAAATGEQRWEVTTAPRVLNAGFAVDGDTGHLCGVGGELHRLDLAAGTTTVVGQTAPEMVLVSPVLVADGTRLVLGTIDGALRAFDLAE